MAWARARRRRCASPRACANFLCAAAMQRFSRSSRPFSRPSDSDAPLFRTHVASSLPDSPDCASDDWDLRRAQSAGRCESRSGSGAGTARRRGARSRGAAGLFGEAWSSTGHSGACREGALRALGVAAVSAPRAVRRADAQLPVAARTRARGRRARRPSIADVAPVRRRGLCRGGGGRAERVALVLRSTASRTVSQTVCVYV